MPMLSSLTSCRDQIDAFTRSGHIFFPDEVALGSALSLVANQAPAPENDPGLPSGYDRQAIRLALVNTSGVLSAGSSAPDPGRRRFHRAGTA